MGGGGGGGDRLGRLGINCKSPPYKCEMMTGIINAIKFVLNFFVADVC